MTLCLVSFNIKISIVTKNKLVDLKTNKKKQFSLIFPGSVQPNSYRQTEHELFIEVLDTMKTSVAKDDVKEFVNAKEEQKQESNNQRKNKEKTGTKIANSKRSPTDIKKKKNEFNFSLINILREIAKFELHTSIAVLQFIKDMCDIFHEETSNMWYFLGQYLLRVYKMNVCVRECFRRYITHCNIARN